MREEEFSLSDWIATHYPDIKGNLKTSVLYTVLGGMMTAFHFLVSGMSWWRHALVDFLFAVAIIWIAVTMWELRAKKKATSKAAPPANPVENVIEGRLKIHSAVRGPSGGGMHDRDVMKEMAEQPRDAMVVFVSNSIFGDHTSGTRKRLKVEYSFGGSGHRTVEIEEDHTLFLPEFGTPATPLTPKLDGEIYRVVSSDKAIHTELMRQVIEGAGKKFGVDIDILVEMYVVNASTETLYIRDLCGSVEIDGVRIPLVRQNDFFAFTIGEGHDYEYSEDKSNPLTPLFSRFPATIEPGKPADGWVRFLLENQDPRKVKDNSTFRFSLKDSLNVEYPITRPSPIKKQNELQTRKIKVIQ